MWHFISPVWHNQQEANQCLISHVEERDIQLIFKVFGLSRAAQEASFYPAWLRVPRKPCIVAYWVGEFLTAQCSIIVSETFRDCRPHWSGIRDGLWTENTVQLVQKEPRGRFEGIKTFKVSVYMRIGKINTIPRKTHAQKWPEKTISLHTLLISEDLLLYEVNLQRKIPGNSTTKIFKNKSISQRKQHRIK